MGWPIGIQIDGVHTSEDIESGVMYIKNSIVSGCDTPLDTIRTNNALNFASVFSSSGSTVMSANSDVMLMDAFNLNGPNAFPQSGSPVYTNAGTPPDDGFFDTDASYIGAFGNKNWTIGWTDPIFVPSTVGVDEKPAAIPSKFSLSQNYPNPFNPTTTIKFSVAKTGMVKLVIYDVLGKEVKTLINGVKDAGYYDIQVNASQLSSGIYLYRLESDGKALTRKMTLLK